MNTIVRKVSPATCQEDFTMETVDGSSDNTENAEEISTGEERFAVINEGVPIVKHYPSRPKNMNDDNYAISNDNFVPAFNARLMFGPPQQQERLIDLTGVWFEAYKILIQVNYSLKEKLPYKKSIDKIVHAHIPCLLLQMMLRWQGEMYQF